MISKTICIATLATAAFLSVGIPASATTMGPRDQQRLGDTEDRKQVRTHEQVRQQQVKQNKVTPIWEPFFHPLYKGSNSPAQQIKRTFN